MHELLSYFFHWYTGQIWPNLLASVLTSFIATVVTIIKLQRVHKRHIDGLHNHISQEFAKLTEKNNN